MKIRFNCRGILWGLLPVISLNTSFYFPQITHLSIHTTLCLQRFKIPTIAYMKCVLREARWVGFHLEILVAIANPHIDVISKRPISKNKQSKINFGSAIGQHQIAKPEFAKAYTDDNFRIIGQARWSFHLSVLEPVYIKNQNPVLSRQKEFVFSLGLFK